jgi:hypothetical protein
LSSQGWSRKNFFLAAHGQRWRGRDAYIASGRFAALALDDLPPLHKDPFDRMLLAQAKAEVLTLLTADALVAQYPGKVRKV